ncbi:ATP-binding protein [Deinococcus sp. QL22]|uniref:ATP-binding protein n=1 Tax=Deinococcus sp. QL22 TaxID=2939437 RepID=UPI002016A97C|nr:ATP-binding protein [Deinococcus sp. QL22]UQN09351.1 ATP-binding protein [Deinococcus sp. QL22]
MSELHSSPRRESLSARLQGVTEALAAVATPADVFEIVLHPALQALGAVAGAILLLHETGDGLRVAATHGYGEGEQMLWQDGTLDAFAPTEDALWRREALYFEHQEALIAAYPDLVAPALGVPVVATAVVPMLLGGQPLGVIVLVFNEPHDFMPEERHFLQILAGQCALALDHLALSTRLRQQAQALQTQAEALSAFVALTEAVGLNTNLSTLLQRTRHVLRAVFPDLFMAYYEMHGNLWIPALLDEVPADLKRLLVAGPPLDTPAYHQAVQTGMPVFVEQWDGEAQRIPHTESFSAGAFAPYFQQGAPVGMLVAGLRGESVWTVHHRAVFTALWRSLGGALDRAEQARQLEGRSALNAFVALTEAVGTETNLHTLALRAQEVVQASFPELSVVYYELEAGLWKAKVVSDNIEPVTAEATRRGYGQDAPSFLAAVQSGAPVFTDGWDAEAEGVAHTEAYGAVAFYPYFRAGQPFAMLVTGTLRSRAWMSRERALFTAVGRSLGLAIERAESVALLASHAAKVESSNAQLEAANEELEAFAYSVSHDLRAPVRHIKSFNVLLRQTLGEELDAKAARYLGIVDTAAGRMNVLIDALLDLSRTSRQPLRIGPVDLEQLIATARADLEPETAQRPVRWMIRPLPSVMADQATLRQVMINLLSNALKYSRTRSEPQIEIWAEERGQEWAIFVRDNGVGFDPRYADKLFGAFQRLHRQEEFEGTGVGLANVRRIVTRHGGTVSAHSQVDQGATFEITLPRPL